MKPTKISELLKKINRIDADADFNAMSKLDIDLILEHLRNLYGGKIFYIVRRLISINTNRGKQGA